MLTAAEHDALRTRGLLVLDGFVARAGGSFAALRAAVPGLPFRAAGMGGGTTKHANAALRPPRERAAITSSRERAVANGCAAKWCFGAF